MSWEKIGVTIVSKPAAHGSGLYVRIPKKTVGAYDLWNAEMVEFTVDRVKRPESGSQDLLKSFGSRKEKKGKGEGEE